MSIQVDDAETVNFTVTIIADVTFLSSIKATRKNQTEYGFSNQTFRIDGSLILDEDKILFALSGSSNPEFPKTTALFDKRGDDAMESSEYYVPRANLLRISRAVTKVIGIWTLIKEAAR